MTTHATVLHDPLVGRARAAAGPGHRDGRRPAGAPPRHVRRLAGARRPGRRPAGGGGGAGRDDGRRRAGRAAHGRRPRTSSSTTSPPRSGRTRCSSRSGCPSCAGWGSHYEKFNRVAQAWAMVGVAALVRRDNGGDRRGPGRADQHGPDAGAGPAVEAALAGSAPTAGAVAARRRARRRRAPSRAADLSASAEYRSHLAGC